MRTCILGIWDWQNAAAVRSNTECVCRLTHADPRCVGSCVIATHIIACELLGATVSEEELVRIGAEYAPEIEEFVRLGFQPDLGKLNLDDRGTKGYTLRTLTAGLWATISERISVRHCRLSSRRAAIRIRTELSPEH